MDNMYSEKLFLNAVIPLMKEVALRTPLKKSFEGKSGIIQISTRAGEEKWGTHFVVENGEIKTQLGLSEISPDVELSFSSLEKFIAFFKGSTKSLPKIHGFTKPGLLIATFKTLLKMSSLLGAKEAPKEEEVKILTTRLYFYLLSGGISVLNKCGHPEVSRWTAVSPDRVYGWSVDGQEDVSAYLRIKAGKSKAARGKYTRSKPFFNMRFADIDSALAILLQTGDLLTMTAEHKLIMEGAPEFGAKIGDYMMLVGKYVQ